MSAIENIYSAVEELSKYLEPLKVGDEIIITRYPYASDIGKRLFIDEFTKEGFIRPRGFPGWYLSVTSVAKVEILPHPYRKV
jgi:hypothetical protein